MQRVSNTTQPLPPPTVSDNNRVYKTFINLKYDECASAAKVGIAKCSPK